MSAIINKYFEHRIISQAQVLIQAQKEANTYL